MIYVLGKVGVGDLEQFMGVFSTRGAQARKKHGSLGCRVFRVTEEENRVVALFTWESREAFDDFLNDPQVKATMQASGTMKPEFTLLDELGTFPA